MRLTESLARERARRARRAAADAPAPAPPEPLLDYVERVAPAHAPAPAHLRRLVALLERAIRERTFAIVSMPPRHAKTTTVRRALAYAIKAHPDRLNGLGMYAERSAQHQSRQIRKMARADGVALAPDAQSVGLWLTPEEGGLYAGGVLGQWTGKGIGGVLVLDDPLKGREAAESPTIRERTWDTFTDDIFSRLEPPVGSLVIVTTRWNEDDVPGRLIALAGKGDFPAFEVINLPALRDPVTGEPSDADDALALWPERFPAETLRKTRAVLGPYGWGSLYQGRPTPRGGKVFKQDPARFAGDGVDGRRLVLSLDAAGTEGTESDYTVCLALAFDGAGDALSCNVLDMLRVRLEPQDAAPKLLAFQRDHGGGELHIEASRDGRALEKALRAIAPGLRTTLVPPVGDKYTRAQPVAAAWNATPARVAIPADAVAHPWVVDFLDEARKFTGMGDKHDDIVDALAHGWNVAALPAPVRQWSADETYTL